MQSVFDQCLRALANLGALLQELADAPATANTAALDLLRQQQQQADAGVHSPGGTTAMAVVDSSKAAGGLISAVDRFKGLTADSYVRAEYDHVWQEMQEECQLLLAELLHAPLRSLAVAGANTRYEALRVTRAIWLVVNGTIVLSFKEALLQQYSPLQKGQTNMVDLHTKTLLL